MKNMRQMVALVKTRTAIEVSPSIHSKINALDFKTYVTEDELDYAYYGAMEMINKINVPEIFD